MNFVKLVYNGRDYVYSDASNIEMNTLGDFLAHDIDNRMKAFRDWALNKNEHAVGGDLTLLDKKGNTIILTDMYSEEDVPTELKMTVQQFVQLLDDWRDMVCSTKPREVIIKYENNQFIIETKN